jgi:acetyl esterase/lipase
MPPPPRPPLIPLAAIAALIASHVATVPAATEDDAASVIPLWPAGNPAGWSVGGGEEAIERDDGIARLRNISAPSLAHFPASTAGADNRARPAVIICPGGGYSILAIDHEGYAVAEFLAGRGVDAFVLKYRLPREGRDDVRHAAALQDAQRAVSLVRHRAQELGIDPGGVGIMGFSAGGHLAAITSTRFAERSYPATDVADAASPRPDFTALIYPAYLVEKDDPAGTLTPDLVLSDQVPPTFFAHAGDDPVTVKSSVFYYLALQRLGVPAEMHLFGEGGHGYGITKARDLPVGTWPDRLAEWITWVTRHDPSPAD